MAEDGCINNAIFQNIDILGKVEFKDFVSSGSSTFGTSTGEIITINGRFKMPNTDDVWGITDDPQPTPSDNKKVLVRQTNNELRFEPKAERVFKTIAVDNQTNIVASNLTDTFTLKPGTNMTIDTNASDKSITFS